MFDVGFWEMTFIGVIALVVIGPEKLPRVARTVGLWVGKGRRMINDVKSDIKKEMDEQDLQEFRSIQNELTSAKDSMRDMAGSVVGSSGIKEAGEEIKNTMDKTRDDLREVETLNSPDTNTISQSKTKKSAQKKVTSKKTKKTAAKKATASKKVGAKKSSHKNSTRKKTDARKTVTGKPIDN